MKARELREKPREEIEGVLREKRERAAELRFLSRQRKTKNVKELGRVRKDIARILTILRSCGN